MTGQWPMGKKARSQQKKILDGPHTTHAQELKTLKTISSVKRLRKRKSCAAPQKSR